MDDLVRRELATLRRRAYGPDADLAEDPLAFARLQELEAALRAADVGVGAPDDPPARQAAPADERTADHDPRDVSGADLPITPAAVGAAPPDEPPPARRPRRIAPWWIVAWAASVLVVALVVGGLVFAFAAFRVVTTDTGARQIATLDDPVEPGAALQNWLGSREAVVYRFAGLTVARTPWGLFSDSTQGCLLVVDADIDVDSPDGAINGPIYTGCRAGAFPAVVQLVVGPQSRPPLRERFADGTALQFVLDGDVVGVFVGPDETPPADAHP